MMTEDFFYAHSKESHHPIEEVRVNLLKLAMIDCENEPNKSNNGQVPKKCK